MISERFVLVRKVAFPWLEKTYHRTGITPLDLLPVLGATRVEDFDWSAPDALAKADALVDSWLETRARIDAVAARLFPPETESASD